MQIYTIETETISGALYKKEILKFTTENIRNRYFQQFFLHNFKIQNPNYIEIEPFHYSYMNSVKIISLKTDYINDLYKDFNTATGELI